jgi:cytoskeletal protein CcmA (bactofilin family)
MNESNKASPSFISNDIKIEGHINSTGTILISGQVMGNVTAKSLTLESTGLINGNVKADETELMGTQKGNIKSRRLSLLIGSKLRGNVNCEELIAEHGCDITGKIVTSKRT